MKTHTLGRTDLQVTPLGLGLAALGRPGYINLGHAQDLQQNYDVTAMQAQAHAVLDAAWEAGIRYFDAARSYGRAEAFLGSWLRARGLAPASVAVGSKWGYTYTADWQVDADVHEVKEHSLPVLNRQIDESRDALGRYLDLYQIHSATLSSGVLGNRPVLDRLAALRNEGLLIGLSLSGANQAETLWQALAIRYDGKPLFASVQATWNLLERSAEEALMAASHEGWGVIVKEALANGRLTSRNDDPAFADKFARLKAVAARHGGAIDALALAAVLARPWATIVLSGAARADHLQSNVRALDVEWDDATEKELATLVETPEQYWQIRSDLAWN